MTAWATPKDVEDLTGLVGISEADIAIAQGIVDLHSSIDSDMLQVQLLWPKDISRLRKATAYQTKFMSTQVDLLGRQDVKTISQDGISATFATLDSVTLGPLARLAISKLSWKRPRPLRSRNRSRLGVLELMAAWPRDAEPGGGWRPM
jgi:hypothetical protein